jgi:hypothetical protein
MALTPAQVRVGTTGAVYTAATTATAPTTATATLTGFTDLGYLSTDGVTETRDRSTNQIRGWQNGDLIREVVTEETATFQFMLLETSAAVLAAFYGVSVDTGNGSVTVNPGTTGGKKSFVIDVIDGADAIRTYIPTGEVLSVGEQVFQNGEPIGFDITITAYVDTAKGYAFKKFYSALDAA